MEEIKNIGYIYKITNLVNGKIYIGQTSKSIEQRWNRHKRDSERKNRENYNYPLYKAFRKYGIDNFEIEEIEQCEVEKLNDREIYWISFYDSFNKKGYNQTLGGDGHRLYNLNEKEVVNKYKELKTLIEVSKYFNCGEKVVSDILKKNNVKIRSFIEIAKEKGNKIFRCDLEENILEEYLCLNDAGKWLIENNLTDAKDARNAGIAIKKNIIKRRTYKGFLWKCDSYENIDSVKYFENEIKLKKERYKSKPIIKIKTKECLHCGKLISNNSTLCIDCFKKEQGKHILPRDILKEKIRNTSFIQLGKEYDVSDNAIRNWCKKYNLPYTKKEIKKYTDEEWKNL